MASAGVANASDAASAMSEQPSSEDISRFIEVFNRLDSFSGQTFLTRGYGAFDHSADSKECPDPATQKVLGWLKSLVSDSPSTKET